MRANRRNPFLSAMGSVILAACLYGPSLIVAQTTAPFENKLPSPESAKKTTPFQASNGQIPPKSQYSGPLFRLSKDWPQKPLPPMSVVPWREAIHGQTINQQNAEAYVEALKAYVSANARQLVLHYDTWDASKAKWYNEPWLGSKREAIHGTYGAGDFAASVFQGTGLKVEFQTDVLTYYDQRAAYTIFRLWGASAMKPDVRTANSQFEEGAVIVKAAFFASADPKQPTNWWDAMQGAAEWPLYIGVPQFATPPNPPQVFPAYLAQFDIIVKDTASSPKTGWVFSTLVYDKDAPGSDAWDKMVPLGAMWGNDPDVTDPTKPLTENWINPNAPKYSTQTLGWGGRLSGPNDGAQNNISVNGTLMNNAPDSSCMSCHGPSEWNVQKHKQESFILPSFQNATPPPSFQLCGPGSSYICSPAPASAAWMQWFQSRPGTQPQDAGSAALDYDEVFAFKALPLWWAAVGPPGQAAPTLLLPSHGQRYNQYTGAPLNPKQ